MKPSYTYTGMLLLLLPVVPMFVAIADTSEKGVVTYKTDGSFRVILMDNHGVHVAGVNQLRFSLKGCGYGFLFLSSHSTFTKKGEYFSVMIGHGKNKVSGIKDSCFKCSEYQTKTEERTHSCDVFYPYFIIWDNSGTIRVGEGSDVTGKTVLSYTSAKKFSVNFLNILSKPVTFLWKFRTDFQFLPQWIMKTHVKRKGMTVKRFCICVITSLLCVLVHGEFTTETDGHRKVKLLNDQGLYIWNKKKLTFDIKGCAESYVVLSEKAVFASPGQNYFFVHFGTKENKTRYTIRVNCFNCNPAAQGTGKGVACNDFSPFFITWDNNGSVNVGTGKKDSESVVLAHKGSTSFIPVFLNILSQRKSAEWRFGLEPETQLLTAPPGVQVTCTSNTMDVRINKTSLVQSHPGLDVSLLTLSDKNCKAIVHQHYVQLLSDLSGCQTKRQVIGNLTVFHNTVIFDAKNSMNINCSVDWNAVSKHRVESTNLSTTVEPPSSKFQLTMHAYKDELFTKRIKQLPMTWPRAKKLFIDVQLWSPQSRLTIRATHCHVKNRLKSKEYHLILNNSCPSDQRIRLLRSTPEHFRFELQSSVSYQHSMYVVCNVTICNGCGKLTCSPVTKEVKAVYRYPNVCIGPIVQLNSGTGWFPSPPLLSIMATAGKLWLFAYV